MNIQAKCEGRYVMEADYYPKLFAGFTGFQFDRPLGRVFTPGPLNVPVAVDLVGQDLGLTTVTAVQPITCAAESPPGSHCGRGRRADRPVPGPSGGLCDCQRCGTTLLRAAGGQPDPCRVQAAAAAAERMGPALASSMEARIAGVEAKQAIEAVSSQAAELEEQLNGLVQLPLCTRLELVEPPPPAPCVRSAEEAISLALESSPEVFQADQDAVKAHAGVRVAKVDYLPDVLLLGGYVNQNGINVI